LTLQGLLRLYSFDFERQTKQLLDWVYIPSLEESFGELKKNMEEFVTLAVCPKHKMFAVNTRETASHRKGRLILFKIVGDSKI
jgi:hypothetical protein